MISVVLQTAGEDDEALAGTLASLVSAAADGAVRDVVVVDGGEARGPAVLADATGCTYLRGPKARDRRLSIGAEAAKGPWLLFLAPGVEPEEGWFREARQFIERTERSGNATARAAVFGLAFDDGRRLGRLLFGPPAGSYGLLIHRMFLDRLGGFRHLPAVESVDLVRRIGPTRIARLRSRLHVSDRAVADVEFGTGAKGALGAGLLALHFPPRLVARLFA